MTTTADRIAKMEAAKVKARAAGQRAFDLWVENGARREEIARVAEGYTVPRAAGHTPTCPSELSLPVHAGDAGGPQAWTGGFRAAAIGYLAERAAGSAELRKRAGGA